MRFVEKAAYGVGQLSDGVKQAAFNTFLFFYYNQVLGLPGSLAGTAALLALVVDAFTDPMIGKFSDNFQSRWGRRHPFMLAGAVPFGLAIAALFAPPIGLEQIGLFGWMLAWTVAVRLMLTLFFVPHLSLGAELVKDYYQRTSLIGYRVFFTYSGILITSIVGFVFFFPKTEAYPNGMMNSANYAHFGVFCGLLGSVAMLVSVFSTRHTIPRLIQPAQRKRDELHPLLGFIAVFKQLQQQSFRSLFSATLLFNTMAGVVQTLLIYVASYVFGFGPEHLGVFSLSILLGIVLASPTAQFLSKRFDKKQALALCVTIGSLVGFSSIIISMLGLLDGVGVTSKLALVFITNGISQIFFIAYIILIDSMLSDTIDEHELNSGKREEGLFFSARSLATKASYGLGSFVAGVSLDIIRFPKGADLEAVSPDMVFKLSLIAGPVCMVFFIATVFLARNYSLNAKRHAEIRAGLANKAR